MKRILGTIFGLFLSTQAQAQYLTPAVNSNLFPSTPSAGMVPMASSPSAADWTTGTLFIDSAFGSTRGAILERGASVWSLVGPGTSGKPWVSNGAGADPAYQTLGIVGGGTNCAAASGTCLDNITGFASTGLVNRTGAGAYSFVTLPLSVANGGTGGGSASGTLLDNITGFASTGLISRTGAGTYSFTTPAAITQANDTNVTLTLGGTPATAALQAVSFTMGWTGTLALTRGGTGSGTAAGALINLFPTPTRAGDIPYWNGSNFVLLAGNNSGTNCFQENASGVPSFGTCGGGTNLPGAVFNFKASLAAAGATITPTADAVTVCTALNGTCYALSSYSQTFNGAGTGAGGMDTGAIPTSSWLALYAIYNPSGPTVSILGTTCAVSCPTIYAGGHMPATYTASALLTVLPTNATPAIAISYAFGRKVSTGVVQLLSSSASSASCTSVSLTTAVPPNAVKVSGQMFVSFASNAAAANFNMFVAIESTCNIGFQQISSALPITAGSATLQAPFTDLALPTAQTLWAGWANTGTTPLTKVNVLSYTIPEAE